MPDIFVSYSRDDQPTARLYAEGFEREGFTVWWDQSLTPGEAFDQVTERALDEAGAVVVLWSKTSVNSRWVRAEATQANASGRLMPVMIEPCRRPIMFELTHTAELSHWDGDAEDPAWQTFVAGVRRVVQRNAPASAAAAGAATPIASPPTAASPAAATVPAAREAQPAPHALPPTPKPVPKTAPRPQAAPAAPEGVPRRNVLLYGASAAGLVAAGFAGGALLKGGREPAPEAPPTFQRITFRRGLVRSARFAPDGQTILYGALWDGDLCRVYTTRADNPESRPVSLPNANVLAVSKTGDLALSLGPNLEGVFTYGTLARAPIAGGAPRELVEDVKFADWSPDGAELAIIRYVEGADRLEYPVGKVLFQPKAGEGTGLGFVRIAPDGRRVAFVHYRAPGSLVGRVMVADGDRITPLTEESVNIHGLTWRGEEIWYSASNDRPLFRSINAVRPGSSPRVVTRLPVNVTVWDATPDGRVLIAQTDDRGAMIARQHGEANDHDLSWLDASLVMDLSRDGRTILFVEMGQGVSSVSETYMRGIDGSPAIHLGQGVGMALSPDKHWALLQRTPAAIDVREAPYIEMVPTGAGESQRLPGEGLRFAEARWLPDGQRIIVRAAEGAAGMRLFSIELPQGQPQPFSPEGIGSWRISPDGSMVAARGAGDPGIVLYPVAGGAARAIPGTDNGLSLIGWTRDGLLVMRPSDPESPRGEVYLLDPATGRRRPWSNILPRDGAGVMLLNSFATTPDGTTHVFSWHRALSNLYIANGLA